MTVMMMETMKWSKEKFSPCRYKYVSQSCIWVFALVVKYIVLERKPNFLLSLRSPLSTWVPMKTIPNSNWMTLLRKENWVESCFIRRHEFLKCPFNVKNVTLVAFNKRIILNTCEIIIQKKKLTYVPHATSHFSSEIRFFGMSRFINTKKST